VRIDPDEAVLLQGAVTGSTVLEKGVLIVQATAGGALAVRDAGFLQIQGVLAGNLHIDQGGFAVVQGVLVGTVQNDGTLIVDAHEEASDLVVSGSGAVRASDELSPKAKAMLPRAEFGA
jgi:hypothetical protein